MRINPNPTPDLLAALAQTQKQQDTALLQLASGRRVNTPSDDPAAAAVLVQLADRNSQTDTFLRSMSTLQGQLQMADSTLSSVVLALQRAITLGIEGANGTLTDVNRAAIATELQGVQEQLISLANLSFQGRFVFSGTAQVQPFVADPTSPSGVRYDGNAGVNSVAIGNGFHIQVNLPGSQVFAAPGADTFQAVNDLINALLANAGIDTAVSAVRTAFDHITAQRVFYGNTLNQLEAQQNYLKTQKLELSRQENTVGGADMAAVASRLVNAQNARDAALAAVGRASQANLFDYLA